MTNKLRLWTGPTLVQSVAQQLRDAGLTVTVEGTESVHLLADSAEQVLTALPAGRGWRLRDVQYLGKV